MNASESAANTGSKPRPLLSLVDTVAIIVGIVIGSGLYETPPRVAALVPDTVWLLGVWAAGGLFALIGALCYAELATAWPEDGGDYVYISRALGRPMGFLFAWSQFWVIRPGSIGAMAFLFARYATNLLPLGEWSFLIYAVGAIAALSVVNLLGVRQGAATQNVLSAAKLVGLLAVVLIGFAVPAPAASAAPAAVELSFDNVRMAMIFVLFTYGGWNDMAYVAAEVRDARRNILRALVGSTLLIAAVYLLVNGALVRSLGLAGLRGSQAVAADAVQPLLGNWGARAVSILVCISALGAINGMLLTGARIYYALGRQHPLMAPLGVWNARWGTPARSLVLQMLVTLGVVAGFALLAGNRRGDTSGFEQMVIFTAPLFWLFLLLTGLSLIVLRLREPAAPRPFRVPGFPLLPTVFCLMAGLLVHASASYAWVNYSREIYWTLAMLALGLVMMLLDTTLRGRRQNQS